MKTLLIATDFSANAKHAACYGYQLASRLGAKVLLVHAFIVSTEIPQSGMEPWPDTAYEDMFEDGQSELIKLKAELENMEPAGTFRPVINTLQQIGTVCGLLQEQAQQHGADMVIMGTHSDDSLGTWLIGNHCRKVISALDRPLLFVPPAHRFNKFGKLVFASDFSDPVSDIHAIKVLVTLARPNGASIILVHTYNGQDHAAQFREFALRMLGELAERAGYERISCHVLENTDIERGLAALVKAEQADLLALVHHQHGWAHEWLLGDHSKKMADATTVPLLVFKGTKD